jgi:hypothetical protein
LVLRSRHDGAGLRAFGARNGIALIALFSSNHRGRARFNANP